MLAEDTRSVDLKHRSLLFTVQQAAWTPCSHQIPFTPKPQVPRGRCRMAQVHTAHAVGLHYSKGTPILRNSQSYKGLLANLPKLPKGIMVIVLTRKQFSLCFRGRYYFYFYLLRLVALQISLKRQSRAKAVTTHAETWRTHKEWSPNTPLRTLMKPCYFAS